MHHPIALTIGTEKGGIRAHRGTKFGYNTINGHKWMCLFYRPDWTVGPQVSFFSGCVLFRSILWTGLAGGMGASQLICKA